MFQQLDYRQIMRGATNKIVRFIVTAFRYYFPWSAQLSRVPTVCCLDTPLFTRDHDSARRLLQPTCPLHSINWHIEGNRPSAWSLGRAANYWSFFNSSSCHYSYKGGHFAVVTWVNTYEFKPELWFGVIKTRNSGFLLKPETRVLKKEPGFANPTSYSQKGGAMPNSGKTSLDLRTNRWDTCPVTKWLLAG